MGFFFRKSVNFGPFRLNFSKSGIGASFGVRGARVSSGPSGTYIHTGTNGFYYKRRIDSVAAPQSAANPIFGNAPPGQSARTDQPITTDITSKKLLEEIHSRIRQEVPTNFIAAICLTITTLALSFLFNVLVSDPRFSQYTSPMDTRVITVGFPLATVFVGSVFIIGFYRQYSKNRTSELVYVLSDAVLNRFTRVNNACQILSGSKSIWRLSTLTNDSNQALDVRKDQPPFLETNVEVWSLDSNRISVYFLPDYIFVWINKVYATVAYESLSIHFSKDSYLSTNRPPTDATVLGYRFQHTRKDGGRDLRYKHNPAYPIVQFGIVTIVSKGGLNLRLQVSNVNAAKAFVDILSSVVNDQSKKSDSNFRNAKHNYDRGSKERNTSEGKSKSNNHQNRPGNSQTQSPDVKSALATLEIQVGASREEILAAYRNMAKSYHPDKVAQHSPRIAKLAEEKMKEINHALMILKRNGLA